MRFIKVCRNYTVRAKCATAISIYQASDEVLGQFDSVIVLNEGHVAYHGPVAEAKPYFESLGFYCSPQTTLSDFLTSMSGNRELREVKEGIERPVPLTSADFEVRFRESRFYQSAMKEAKSPQPLSSKLKPSKYALPMYSQIYECAFRHYQIHLSDRASWVAEAAGTIVQALLLGTLFRNQSDFTEGLYTRCSALFFCVLIMGLQASAEFGNTFSQRPLLLKQKSLRFYRPGAYALGQILSDIAWKFVFVLYSLPIYWMVNFRRTPGGFFTWLVSLYASLMALAVTFRTIAVFTTSPTRAILPVGLLLNVLIIYTGFYVNPPGQYEAFCLTTIS
jgi:ABC-type multidrug transport system permease subunit